MRQRKRKAMASAVQGLEPQVPNYLPPFHETSPMLAALAKQMKEAQSPVASDKDEGEEKKKKKKNRRKKNRKKKCACPCHTFYLDESKTPAERHDDAVQKSLKMEDGAVYCAACGPMTDGCAALN